VAEGIEASLAELLDEARSRRARETAANGRASSRA
jgi:hypothetical protein